METALKICKRLHSYLYAGQFHGKVTGVYDKRLDMETPFGLIAVVQRECLNPFSCLVGSLKPFTALGIRPGMDVLLDKNGLDIPQTELVVDVTMAEDVDLSMDAMTNLFLPMDLNMRLRHVRRAIEQGAGSEDLSLLALSPREAAPLAPLGTQLKALSDGLEEGDMYAACTAAAAAAGFGSGSVPASDILLSGYMAAYTALSFALGRSLHRVRDVTRQLAAAAAQNTNENGAAALLQAGEGLVDEDRFQLLRSLFSDTAYTTLSGCAMRIAGAESGVNFLTGICVGITGQYLMKTI